MRVWIWTLGDFNPLYEHRYKHGKQKEIMTLQQFQKAFLEAAEVPLSWKAFIVLLWHTGVRKSELYERVKEDVKVTDEYAIIDFHKRKKRGDEVAPLKIPLSFYGMTEYVLPYLGRVNKRKTFKSIFYQEPTGKFKEGQRGKKLPIMRLTYKVVKDHWLFPLINSTTAWLCVKTVLGEKFYPHYLRLRKLSAAGRTATNYLDFLAAVKSISGLKTITAINAYTGSDEAVRKKAMEGSE